MLEQQPLFCGDEVGILDDRSCYAQNVCVPSVYVLTPYALSPPSTHISMKSHEKTIQPSTSYRVSSDRELCQKLELRFLSLHTMRKKM